MKKDLYLLTAVILSVQTAVMPLTAFGNEGDSIYYSTGEENISEGDVLGYVETASYVTEEMCTSSYWYDKNEGSGIEYDKVLISPEEIRELNSQILITPGTNMNDLENMDETYNAAALRDTLVSGITAPTRELYANGELISDNTAYYKIITNDLMNSAFDEEKREVLYSVAVKRTPMRSIPTTDYIGYSSADTDDEIVSSAINVNEPFVIKQRATISGNDYYWGYSDHCTGWIEADDLAICDSKDQWLDAWKVDPDSKDFIVVTDNKIVLEPSVFTPYSSEVKLTFATILKEVPREDIPQKIGERGGWNNHVVYLPTRDENGKYEKKIALISQHYKLNHGFDELTQQHLLDVAFNNIGDRYGWGGMLDSMDCSHFTRNVYKCFGLNIPRNTTWQQLIPGRLISLSGMTDDEKINALKHMPAGTLLYFPGHAMIYTGYSGDLAYVISDTGSLSDSDGDLNVRSMNSIILNPLSVRRRAGTTWLTNLANAVLPISETNYAAVAERIAKGDQNEEKEPVIVPENGKKEPKISPLPGQSFASSADTLALDTFACSNRQLYIDFSNVSANNTVPLKVTCIKGAVITTKVPMESVTCDRKVARVKKNKKNSLAKLVMKGSGSVSFNTADGRSYPVDFVVETPKPQKKAAKISIGTVSGDRAEKRITLTPMQLFNTTIDGGKLSIVRSNNSGSVIKDNVLVLDTGEKSRVKLCYEYLDKRFMITVNIK